MKLGTYKMRYQRMFVEVYSCINDIVSYRFYDSNNNITWSLWQHPKGEFLNIYKKVK